jgi:glutamate decarboxylase
MNGLNIKLHKALRLDDTNFVSRTTLESTRYRPQNIVVLRAVPINPLTTRSILREIVETQNRIGLRMWKEFEPAYRRVLKDHFAESPSEPGLSSRLRQTWHGPGSGA